MLQGISYSKLKKTDFFIFFNLSEIQIFNLNTSQYSKKILLKPGGFQDFIDICFHISNDRIILASLSLDRNWIGNVRSINPFAKDITKSFLMTLLSKQVNEEFKIMLVQGIWNMKGSEDHIYCIDKVIHNWESSNLEVKKFINVFQGVDDQFKKDFGSVSLTMINDFYSSKNSIWLNIILSWNENKFQEKY